MKRYLMSDIWMILCLIALTVIFWLNTKAVQKLTEVIVQQTSTMSTIGLSDEKLYDVLKGEEE